MRIRIAVLGLLLCFALAGGCSSSDPADPQDGGGDGGGGGGGGGPLTEEDNTFGAIDLAIDAGDITPGQGLLYKLQTVYEPDLLPEAFQGGSSFAAESMLYDDVAAVLSGVSPAEEAAILPYLYAPFHVGSWWDLRQKRLKSEGADPTSSPTNLSGDILESWLKLDTADGHVRIWYESAAQLPYAQAVANALSAVVWDQLTTVMGRSPRADGDHGGNSRYDFVVMAMDPGIFGMCNQVYGLLDLVPSCDETATYIEINTGKALDSVPSTVAHEFMHALQRSMSFAGCEEYRWLREATATWAMDYCYPSDDFESRKIVVAGHTLPEHFMDKPELSLDIWTAGGSPYSYGAYLFFQYLSRSFSPNWIRYIWEAADDADSAMALESGLQAAGSTNLQERWPQFTRFLWNQDPVSRFDDWDNLTRTPRVAGGQISAALSSSTYSDSVRLEVSLPRLSSRYCEVELQDDSVSGFFFVNGWNFDIDTHEWNDYEEPGLIGLRARPLPADQAKGRGLDLMYKVTGQDWVTLDLSDSPAFAFCRDITEGDVERAVLVFSNGDVGATDDPKEPVGLAPFIWYDNVGCGKWDGTLSWDVGDGESVYRIDANYTWDTGAQQAGGFSAATPDDDLEGWTSWVLEPVSGSMTWSTSSSFDGCSYQGQATWPVDDLAFYDQLLIRNFVTEGIYERTVTALLGSVTEREVTEVVSGVDCGENLTYFLYEWLEIPHSYTAAKVSSDGGSIDVIYQEYADTPVMELHLNARK